MDVSPGPIWNFSSVTGLPCFGISVWGTQGLYKGLGALGLKGLETSYYSTPTEQREPHIQRRQWPVVREGSWGVSEEICFSVPIFRKTFFITTADKCILLMHSVQCVTVNVAVRLFQLLPSAQCCQFQHSTSCCTVQIHIHSAHLVLFSYTAWISRRIRQIPDSNYYFRHI